jgi:hypothetical protein
MRPTRFLAFALAIAGPVGCGGSDNSSGTITDPSISCNTTTNGTFSATLNGQAWVACGVVSVNKASSILGKDTLNTISWAGSGFLPGNVGYAIVMGASRIGTLAAGAYPVGLVNPVGSNLVVGGSNNAGWGASAVSGSGTLTITAITANHITGTFTFDAAPTTGTASGTLQVRNGKFDLSY